ncbi:hypothetical protein PG993_006465 [Apiospora rasikravindrae]|uniref:Uncharacterized protein n=1 Tax=Apiospora rasikravindrae TaxID=990691 RepID=A0ABR1T5S2_9PEZI
MSSGRASKPAPLNIASPTSGSSSRQNSFGSSSTDHDRNFSCVSQDVPRSLSDSWANYNQAKETTPSPSSQSRSKSFKSAKVTSPTNVYTHCGRHSDQWLFGDLNLFRRNKKD